MEEFLRLGTPQIRKNALTALAVINDEESARLIATAAMEDEDVGVRRRAEEESLLLSSKFLQSVNDVFLKALTSPEFQKQQRAYAILGRLKSEGLAMPHPRMPRGIRMRLAGSMSSYLYPVRNLSFRLRSWQPGLLGTLVGMIPFIVFMVNHGLKYQSKINFAGSLVLWSLVTLIIGTISAIFAAQFATPINLQLRPIAATLVELIAAFVSMLGGGLLLSFLFTFLPIGVPRDAVLLFVPLLALLAAIVRLGTILAFGRAGFFKRLRRKTGNWLIQIVAGTASGFLIATGLYLLFSLYASPYEVPAFKGIWLASLAVAVGMACAFAKIDSEAPPGISVTTRET
jgi:hypothetical protein